MATDDTKFTKLFDDLQPDVADDSMVKYCSYFITAIISALALLCVPQHYLRTPKRLQLPGNEVYKRIAWFKLLSGSVQLILLFGYNPILIYPCCDMLSVHFRALLPIFNAKSYFILLTVSSIVSRFAQVTFVLKRWETNIRGLWFPSFTTLLIFQLCTLFAGTVLFVYYYDWFDDTDILNMDSFGYCLQLGVKLCNKYTVEEDRNHVHIDFRTVGCLRAVSLMQIAVSVITIFTFYLKLLLKKHDVLCVQYIGEKPYHGYIEKNSPAAENRRSTLEHNSTLSIFALTIVSLVSIDVLYRNFPRSVSSTSSFGAHMLTHVINGEFLLLMKSENYYRISHLPEIVRNLRNGYEWYEGILHPHLDFSDSDYY